MKPTQTQINEYVKTLDVPVQELHRQVNTAYFLTCHDTLSDEFQIVANILDVFSKATINYLNIQQGRNTELCKHGKGHCQCDNSRCHNYCD